MSFFETTFCHVTQASFTLTVILMPQPPKCWAYRGVPPGLAHQ